MVEPTRWVSCSRFGSAYEEEADANSHPLRYRHRKRGTFSIGPDRDGRDQRLQYPWCPGKAPDKAEREPGLDNDPQRNTVENEDAAKIESQASNRGEHFVD